MFNDKSLLLKKFIDSNAILNGHFILSSGFHSDTYVQCAKIFEKPQVAVEICNILVEKIRFFIDVSLIDIIVSPAVGGITVGYEVARQLKKNFVFCERIAGKFVLRRGFEIKNSSKVLIVEDVITTGKSSLEAVDCIKEYNGKVVAEAALVKRSSNTSLPFDVVALLDLDIKNYQPDSLPDYLQKIPVSTPGSRYYMNNNL